jgi:hypothetical protein
MNGQLLVSKNKQKQARRQDLKRKRDLRKELGLQPAKEFHYVVVRNIAGQTMQIPVDENGDPVASPDIVLDDLSKFKGVKTLPGSG